MAVFQMVVSRVGGGYVRERIRRRREPIPAAPRGGGGMCAAEAALKSGDIIGMTTEALVSGAIRYWTFSDISHIMIYVGGGQVVEAIDEGVVKRSLDAALDDAVVGVTYRHPGIRPEQQELVRNYLVRRSEEGRGYDTAGAVRAGLPGRRGGDDPPPGSGRVQTRFESPLVRNRCEVPPRACFRLSRTRASLAEAPFINPSSKKGEPWQCSKWS